MYSLAPARIARTAISALGSDAAGDDRQVDALELQALDHALNVEIHVDHHQVGALAAAQRVHRLIDIQDMGNLGAARKRDLTGSGDVAV